MACVVVVRPGLLTSVQDLGRWGWQAWGVSVSGPMDVRAHRAANALVGNDPDAATLEITLTGPELRFEEARTVALAGAEFATTVDQQPVALAAPCHVPSGACLRFGRRQRGTRAYLAIDGGIAVAPVFGSRATHIPSRLGGYGGRPLAAGDRLPLGVPSMRAPHRVRPVVLADGHARVRVLPSPHAARFAPAVLDRFQSGPYVIRPESNRMGYRLEGPRLRSMSGGDQLSEPALMGSIQVPPGGDPILLMADCQTIGGYPVVATVISADLGMAGQLGPGDALSFTVCSRQEAIAALIALERTLMIS